MKLTHVGMWMSAEAAPRKTSPNELYRRTDLKSEVVPIGAERGPKKLFCFEF